MLNRTKPLSLDDMTEEDLISEIMKAEKEIAEGKVYSEEEFRRDTKDFQYDLENVVSLKEAVLSLSKSATTYTGKLGFGGMISITAGHMEKKFNFSPMWHYNIEHGHINSCELSDTILLQQYNQYLETFYNKNIVLLKNDLFQLYKSVSKVVVTLYIGELDTDTLNSTSKTVLFRTLSGLSYAIDELTK